MYMYIYVYIYIWYHPKKSTMFSVSYWYLQCFNKTLAYMFEGIIFECCAWFWDHVFFSYVFYPLLLYFVLAVIHCWDPRR